jgi:tRNA(Met) C34 N-acetyltransferase TmcA
MTTQTLSQGLMDSAVSKLKLCRIHRIAIAPAHQKKGLGHKMLEALHDHQPMLKIDGFTTSFGMTASLDRFWHSNGYEVVKIGQRQDTSSAAVSGHYIHKGLTAYEKIKQSGQMSVYADLKYLNKFHPSLNILICERIKNTVLAQLDARDVYAFCCRKAHAFIDNQLSFTMVRSNLYFIAQHKASLTLNNLIARQHTPHLSKDEKLACIEAIRLALKQQLS